MAAVIDRVDGRGRLRPRREPYWQRLSQGRYLGFRRMAAGSSGTWLARVRDGERYVHRALGGFDSLAEKDRYDAARQAAQELFEHLDLGGTTKRSTVKAACEAYVEKLKLENSAAAAEDAAGRFRRLVYSDSLGRIDLAKLAPRHLADWKSRVLGQGGSRSSYNRNSTALRAALNLARARREVASDHAWTEELKPFEGADGRRNLYLDHAKRRRLVSNASAEARPFFKSLNMLPMRPGELAALWVQHVAIAQRALDIPSGKTESRIIPLTDESLAHFKLLSKAKAPTDWLIARKDGSQWKKEAWRDEIKAAAKKAKLPKETVAYTLRHSLITDLVTGGLDLFTVAKLAGTSVVMIERHYGHLQREHARSALEKLASASRRRDGA